jgi:hypothetical protein
MNDYRLIKIEQRFNQNSLVDIKGEVREQLKRIRADIRPGSSIAIGVGSRGIRNLALVVQTVADFLKENKARPFIIPAMGSHGGATAKGQEKVLAGYGISKDTIGIPVKSSMEVVELTAKNSPCPVFMDKIAFESDGVILINRIKPHTDFHSRYESGLVKMAVIGLGKEKQASSVHSYGVYGLSELIPLIGRQIISSGKIIGGLALVENAYDDTMLIRALKPGEFFEQEQLLLDIARQNMPSLPVNEADVLIIDQMGKDISGVGIDPNIIGRIRITGQREPDNPRIKAIMISDLSYNSFGNAIGIGLSDVITRKLNDKIDFASTYKNAVTSGFLERAKIPVVADDDRKAFEIALRSCGYIKPGEERIIRIKDTLHLGEIYVSQQILEVMNNRSGIEVIQENIPVFNDKNELNPF